MKLVTKRLLLRLPTLKDAKHLQKHVGNINVTRNLLVVPHPYTIKDATWFIKHVQKKAKDCSGYDFCITFKEKDEPIGNISLSSIDRFQGTATIGYWLAEDYWRQGIMSEAFDRILRFAFNQVRLRRINISVFVGNEASKKLIEKMGFSYEGKRIKYCRSKATGKIHDEYVYGLLKEDWEKFKRS
jgi:ribosomal-protein-alanine N-acetyltransferase